MENAYETKLNAIRSLYALLWQSRGEGQQDALYLLNEAVEHLSSDQSVSLNCVRDLAGHIRNADETPIYVEAERLLSA